MKLQATLFVCAATVIGALLVVVNPSPVAAETNLVVHPQVSALVTMAVPPYKW